MERDDIKKLLQRFYEAQTSDDEEQMLRDYFSSGDVAEELQTDRQLFLMMARAGDDEAKVPDGLEARLSALIDSQEPSAPLAAPTVSLRHWLPAVAASLLILFTVALKQFTAQPADVEIDDPQQAYELTCQALDIFAETVNEGMEQAEQATETTIDMHVSILEQLQ